jgi:hypothetical protein
MELSRKLLWGSLIAGVATHLFEVFWMAFAFFEMAQGSCTAALICLWFGFPVAPVGPVLFIIGLILARGSNPIAIKAGVVGVTLSIMAVPLWFHIACSISEAHCFG